jgi:hypothetical protein
LDSLKPINGFRVRNKGCLTIPVDCLIVALGNTHTIEGHVPKVPHGLCITPSCCLLEFGGRGKIISRL